MPLLSAALFVLALTPPAKPVICIDPGHPSEVGAGTRGKKATEVETAWSIALALKERLAASGYAVRLTKSRVDEMVENKRRAVIANAAKAALMVRLHCDAAAGSGFTVYYPSQAGREGTFRGPSPKVIQQSKSAAGRFHRAMAEELRGKLKNNGLKTDLATYIGAKQGALTGSIYSEVPVVLVEMVVLTNPKDEAFIVSAKGRQAMVNALTRGVFTAVPLPKPR